MVTADNEIDSPDSIMDATQLVHREEEWELIEEQIRLRCRGPVLRSSVVVIYGTAGIGKTTFLRNTLLPRLKEHYPLIPHALIDLDTSEVGHRYTDEIGGRGRVVLDIAEELQSSVGQVSKEFLAAKKRWERAIRAAERRPDIARDKRTALLSAEEKLVEEFQQQLASSALLDRERRPVVLVLDTVEDIPRDLLLWIQEVQDRTTETGYILWVMASRSRVDCEPYYLRERYVWRPMQPFSADQVKSQVVPRYQYLAPNLYKLSFGLPAATRALAESVDEIDHEVEEAEHRHLEPQDLEQAPIFSRLIASLNDLLQYHRYLGHKEEDIREALRIMAPLRLFNPGIISGLLPKLAPDHFKRSATGADSLTVIQRMVQTTLVSWDRARRGYCMETPLRRIVALVLEHTDPVLFRQVHEMAAAGYRRWASMPAQEKRKDYIVEAIYHRAWLLHLQGEHKPGPILAQELQQVIQKFYFPEGKPDLTALDALDEIHQQLQSDDELKDLLPASDLQPLLKVVTSPKNTAADAEEGTSARSVQAS